MSEGLSGWVSHTQLLSQMSQGMSLSYDLDTSLPAGETYVTGRAYLELIFVHLSCITD